MIEENKYINLTFLLLKKSWDLFGSDQQQNPNRMSIQKYSMLFARFLLLIWPECIPEKEFILLPIILIAVEKRKRKLF